MKEEMRKFMRHGEAKAVQLPLRPLLHQRVLFGVEVNAAEVGLDGGFHPVFRQQVIERDRIHTEIHFEEGEHIDRRVVFPKQLILGAQSLDLFPDVFHGR
jgi:hypothetical protein